MEKKEIEQSWKEKTKLDNKNICLISLYIVMIIFSLAVAILEKNTPYIIIATLWMNLALTEYFNAKIKKGIEAVSDLKDKELETKDKLIRILIKELNERR